MAFHHLALATRDLEATHAFYTEVMGFTLVKTVVAPTEHDGGWARHVFYDTGGDGLMAFWDLHDDAIGDFDPAISTGHDCMEVDHGFCVSIYTVDPNGIMVEWCADTRPLDDEDRADALAAVHDPHPPLEPAPTPVFHRAAKPVRAG
jgi:catechol 2,3-dioxygenase-like lactoylglutathione lyase family enzyme